MKKSEREANAISPRPTLPWTLPAPPDTAAAIQKNAWNGRDPLHRVYWDPEGFWQFLGLSFSEKDKIEVACLKDALIRWPHVGGLTVLKPGQEATWSFDEFGWNIEQVDEMQ